MFQGGSHLISRCWVGLRRGWGQIGGLLHCQGRHICGPNWRKQEDPYVFEPHSDPGSDEEPGSFEKLTGQNHQLQNLVHIQKLPNLSFSGSAVLGLHLLLIGFSFATRQILGKWPEKSPLQQTDCAFRTSVAVLGAGWGSSNKKTTFLSVMLQLLLWNWLLVSFAQKTHSVWYSPTFTFLLSPFHQC